MKRFIKTAWQLSFVVVVLSLAFIACEDEKSKSGTKHDPNKPVEVFSFQPDSGRIRDKFLINGENFGNDPSIVKVFFNDVDQAIVIGCINEQILVSVPRTAEGRVEVSVQVGSQDRKVLPNQFLYKSSRQVTTVTGTGEAVNEFDNGVLESAKLVPVYIGIDAEQNIFVTTNNDRLVLINEEENTIRTILTGEQGFTHRCTPVTHPVTDWVLLGHESVRDRFLMLDPKSNWAPTLSFIRNWNTGPIGKWDGDDKDERAKYALPSANVQHYCMLYCEYDGFYYTRYNDGQIVRIDPDTWNAEIIGMTPTGRTYGIAFNTDPDKTWELWLAYDDNGDKVPHSLCTVDIRDTQTWVEVNGRGSHPWGEGEKYYLIMSSFARKTAEGGSGYRDGLLEQSLINAPRQISFDRAGILYVGDNGNHCIRKVDTRTGIMSVYVGIPRVSTPFANGNEKDATFRNVHGIVTIETTNDYLIYASDYGNNRIRKIAEE